tara:strand:- start:2 stop:373 length:372 start_codon:yes stop_codon:yes gene_type:complete
MEELRFIGAFDSTVFEVDEWFIERLDAFSTEEKKDILSSILYSLEDLPVDNDWNQITGGVVRYKHPIFYAFEYLKEDEQNPLLLDVIEISSDDYLDLVLENNTIEYYELNDNTKQSSQKSKNL